MNKAKKFIVLICIIIFIPSLCVYFYPDYLEYDFRKSVDKKREEFRRICDEVRGGEGNPLYSELYEAMKEYNKELYESGQCRLVDEYSYEKPDFLLSDYGINNGEVFGFIEIPSAEINLPIINGASYENMMNGAVYLANTSLPIGGINTNCAIAAHNQWKGIYMFMNITGLETGDTVYVKNFWEDMEYSVTETKIIEPDDSNQIMIKSGEDKITLTTCYYTPSGKKRFLVSAEKTT